MIRRLWERLGRWLLTAEVMGILLILLALFAFTNGIASSLRNTNSESFFWICLAAASIGFGLGKIRSNGILASAGMAALGVLIIWILGARLTQPLLAFLRSAFSLIPQIVPAIQSKVSIDTTAMVETWAVVVESSTALWMRVQTWTFGFNKNVTINDALVRYLIWTLVLWLCAAWMGWYAAKRSAVIALLPAISLLAVVTSYSERRIDSLWTMVIILLVLMGVWNYRIHTLQWVKDRMDFSDSIRSDNSQAVIFLTLAIGAFAFIMPSVSWRDIIDYVRERQNKNETAEMFGVKQPVGSGQAPATQEPSLPRDHLLDEGVANSQRIVMTIRTGELPPIPEEFLPSDIPRYYWRSIVYDRYVGTGWVTGTIYQQSVSSNTPLIPGLLNGYHLVHMDVRMVEPEGRLFWSGILFSADIPFTVNWRVRPTSDLFAEQSALLQADMFAASTTAVAYQADTYVPVPSLTMLHSASMTYSDEIRRRYLSLPASVPDRVIDLAHEITDGLSTPYDKAKAIETYLRKNYPYTLDVPSPPEGRDVADYFLFELKKGYCDYYATAMVVLARASGLPARFVSGYSPGSYDAPNAQYIVRELNAHSWVEIYFPDIGWVEFEPTASLPEIERTVGDMPVLADGENEETASERLTRFRLERILLWSSPALVILAAALVYFVFLERWLVLRLVPETAIDNIYQRFYRAGRPLAGAWTGAETSSEFLHKFQAQVRALQGQTRFKKLMTNITLNAGALTGLYHDSLFVDRRTQKQDAVKAWQIWKRMQRQLFNMKLLLKLKKYRVHHVK